MSSYELRFPGDVSNAVRSLLLSTKSLVNSLQLWSVRQATETEVSDVYVQIGTLFNTAIHAFAYHKIDLSDMYTIPRELRTVLEHCLAEDPSPETLDYFMPELRQILYQLFNGLLLRQEAWRAAIS